MKILLVLANQLLDIYSWIIIISAFSYFLMNTRFAPIMRLIVKITEPVYRQIRRVIPTIYGNIDLAPLIVLIAISVIKSLISYILYA